MTVSTNPDLAALETMTVAELRERYVRLFGETTTSHNRLWLLHRIAWRMQALAEGDLSQRAQGASPNWPTTPTSVSVRPDVPGATIYRFARPRRHRVTRAIGSINLHFPGVR